MELKNATVLVVDDEPMLLDIFREWLEQFTAQTGGVQEFDALMKRLKHVEAVRRFTRDEMNER